MIGRLWFSLEKFVPTDDLRIMPVLDFEPSRVAVLGCIATVPVLGNNALQVPVAHHLEQALAVSIDVVYAKQELRCRWHDAA